jgi:hypothetical protein
VPADELEPEELSPLDVDGVAAVGLGTVGFGIALIGCLIYRDTLTANGQQWWTWVCATGALLGLAGLAFVLRRRAAYRAHRAKNLT